MGKKIVLSDAVLSPVVSAVAGEPRRERGESRRLRRQEPESQNRDPEKRLLGTAEPEIGAPGLWIECAAVRGTCGLR